jgi:hypothetical protein
MNRKGFGLLLVFGVVALAAVIVSAGFWYISKSTHISLTKTSNIATTSIVTAIVNSASSSIITDISGWKIYNNQKLNLSFRYPSSWFIYEQANNQNSVSFLKPPEVGVLEVSISAATGTLEEIALHDIAKNDCKIKDQDGHPVDHIIETKFPGIMYVLNCSISSERYGYAFLNGDGKIINFYYHDDFDSASSTSEKVKTLNAIIGTIGSYSSAVTSTDLASSSATTLKTYTDPEFTMMIPSDWTAVVTSTFLSSVFPGDPSSTPLRSIIFSSPKYVDAPVLFVQVVPHGYDLIDRADDAPARLATSSFYDFYYSTWNGNAPMALLDDVKQAVKSFQLAQLAGVDNRILLTPNNVSQYDSFNASSCAEKFNFDQPDSRVAYADTSRGLSFSIPYNKNWGSDTYRINPYDETSNSIAFGPIGSFEGCGWIRSYFLSFLPAQSAQQVLTTLKNASSEFYVMNPTTTTINNLTVVKYETAGLCAYPKLQVVGVKYNYEVSPLCSDDFKPLEDIVKTISIQ